MDENYHFFPEIFIFFPGDINFSPDIFIFSQRYSFFSTEIFIFYLQEVETHFYPGQLKFLSQGKNDCLNVKCFSSNKTDKKIIEIFHVYLSKIVMNEINQEYC